MVNLLRFRAWHKTWEEMGKVKRIRFDDDGNVTTVLFRGKDFGVNATIDKIVLMQSTGLKDKNGKEIFEKDILDYNGRKVIVKWHGSYACFIYNFVDGLKNRTAEWQPLYLSYYKFEIVGNSLENPELLEVTE
nr:MAG TPA: YopX protein [Caudoviricetes sp.]